MREPRTEAGKALRRDVDRWLDEGMTADQYDAFRSHVAAIEEQAARDERARVRAAVEAMPTARIISQWDLVSRRAVLALLDDPS